MHRVDRHCSFHPTPAIRKLAGINLEDRQHCIDQIFPHLRYSILIFTIGLSQGVQAVYVQMKRL
jgi:hypothetical protein